MPDRRQPMLYVADLDGCSALTTMSPEALSAVFVAALERAGPRWSTKCRTDSRAPA
jgi:hypothetical protein